MSARDELEAVIWRHWPARGPEAAQAVDAILGAADAYAIAEGGRTAQRRATLARAVLKRDPDVPVVHWQHIDRGHGVPACRSDALSKSLTVASRASVTCGQCKRTLLWKEADKRDRRDVVLVRTPVSAEDGIS